ncbi:MAG TPA: phosphate/phosphite/phosphonate ABC transporter substrate-binding protein [Candidatus Rokubacteria bacterium]|nr:phosphate/phosphite/phosphonate ABC transporter substrate-binding protein [Candidatus Rokubacteria bacterium]
MRTLRSFTLLAVLAAVGAMAVGLGEAAEACNQRGRLDVLYCDDNGDGIPDVPKDPARLLNPDILVFAYVPVEDPAVYGSVFADLLRHVEKATGKKTQFFGPQNYAAQLEAMRSGRLHITGYSTGSLPYGVNLAGAVPFAQMATVKGARGYRLIVIAQAGNAKINSVADLKGKRVAHVSQTSNSGHQAPVYFFSKAGVVPGKDYQIAFSGKHDNSVLGVVNGDYDAAAVADSVLERMVNRGVVKATEYKVVYTSPVFPTAGFAYYHALEPRLAEKIKEAFYTFKIQGTSLGKEFRDSVGFVPIDYKRDWEPVVGILEANGAKFTRDSPEYKKFSAPPKAGE